MTSTLQSYSQDRWQDGSGDVVTLADAATGEPVANIPRTGPGAAAMLTHARTVGGPALPWNPRKTWIGFFADWAVAGTTSVLVFAFVVAAWPPRSAQEVVSSSVPPSMIGLLVGLTVPIARRGRRDRPGRGHEADRPPRVHRAP